MQIFVKKTQGNTTTLNVESNERIFTIKRKLKEKEGIRSGLHLGLIYNGTLLEDGHTLAHYNISKQSTLRLFLSQDTLEETWDLDVETWSKKSFTLKVKSVDTIDDVKAKIQAQQGIPPHKQLLFDDDRFLEDGSCTLADYYINEDVTLDLAILFEQGPSQPKVMSEEGPRQTKRARPASPIKATSIFDTCDGEAAVPLMPESQACTYSSVLSELEDVKRELATARNKEKELQATISRLEAQNKKNEQELTIKARNKEKELEAIISGLKAEHKKNEEDARDKEKGLESTISGLMHKNKVFSHLCASYESLVEDLEVGNKKCYAGARATGYAEGLKEGKAKRLKSVEFLHRLTDTSMQYFNHGFDSCQKQAEEQGFSGQLNKDSALKDAPVIKGWDSSHQPH